MVPVDSIQTQLSRPKGPCIAIPGSGDDRSVLQSVLRSLTVGIAIKLQHRLCLLETEFRSFLAPTTLVRLTFIEFLGLSCGWRKRTFTEWPKEFVHGQLLEVENARR